MAVQQEQRFTIGDFCPGIFCSNLFMAASTTSDEGELRTSEEEEVTKNQDGNILETKTATGNPLVTKRLEFQGLFRF